MKEIISKTLKEIACGSTGSCQINLQSESAQIMIAEKLEIALRPYVSELIEEIICPSDVPTNDL